MMKTAENNVKWGEFIFDHKFYLKTTKFPLNFVPRWGFCKKICPRGGVFDQRIKWPRDQPGGGYGSK